MAFIRSYSISKVNLQVECEDHRLAKKVIGVIDDCFFMRSDSSTSDSHNIILIFKNDKLSFNVPETARELSASSSMRVLKDGDSCYLIRGDSVFQLNLANSLGIGFIDSNFLERPPKSQQELLMLALLWLLRRHGLYGLHANAIVKDGLGILFVGGTCSGKSTTSLSLIRQGWRYLSDDVTLLRHSPNGIQAITFQKGFSFDPNLANHYPELEEPLRTAPFNGKKRFLDIDPIYPDRFLPCCLPKVLIFPKIVSHDKSELIPVNRAMSLILLSQNSGGTMVDKEMVKKQIEVLKQLVYQTSSYQLLAGRDLYEKPEKISEILSWI